MNRQGWDRTHIIWTQVLTQSPTRSLTTAPHVGYLISVITMRNVVSNVHYCDHEEADTRMFLHASAAVSAGHKRIMIRSTDSDVIVLGIAAVCFLKQHGLQELWVSFGTGNRSRFVTHLKSNTSNDAYNHLHSTGAFHCREPRGWEIQIAACISCSHWQWLHFSVFWEREEISLGGVAIIAWTHCSTSTHFLAQYYHPGCSCAEHGHIWKVCG